MVRVYAKLGYGYIVRQGLVSGSTTVLTDREIFRPVYGAGFDFRIHKRWHGDVSWLQAAPQSKCKLPATNFSRVS